MFFLSKIDDYSPIYVLLIPLLRAQCAFFLSTRFLIVIYSQPRKTCVKRSQPDAITVVTSITGNPILGENNDSVRVLIILATEAIHQRIGIFLLWEFALEEVHEGEPVSVLLCDPGADDVRRRSDQRSVPSKTGSKRKSVDKRLDGQAQPSRFALK